MHCIYIINFFHLFQLYETALSSSEPSPIESRETFTKVKLLSYQNQYRNKNKPTFKVLSQRNISVSLTAIKKTKAMSSQSSKSMYDFKDKNTRHKYRDEDDDESNSQIPIFIKAPEIPQKQLNIKVTY